MHELEEPEIVKWTPELGRLAYFRPGLTQHLGQLLSPNVLKTVRPESVVHITSPEGKGHHLKL
jgi:hypothetical protein